MAFEIHSSWRRMSTSTKAQANHLEVAPHVVEMRRLTTMRVDVRLIDAGVGYVRSSWEPKISRRSRKSRGMVYL